MNDKKVINKKICKKVKYSSEYYAKIDMARIRKRSNRAKLPRSVYFCEECKAWHLTSKLNQDQEIAELNVRVNELEQKLIVSESNNKTLLEENSKLKNNKIKEQLLYQKDNKELLKEVKVDQRVVALATHNKEQKKTIAKLRSEKSDLITNLLRMEKLSGLKIQPQLKTKPVEYRTVGRIKYSVEFIPCSCECHRNNKIRHIAPCCKDGYVEIFKKVEE